MKRWAAKIFLTVLTLALLAAHQDWWNWGRVDLLFGFVPVGLWYHAIYSVACAVLMGLMVWLAWPKELEKLEKDGAKAGGAGPDEGGHE